MKNLLHYIILFVLLIICQLSTAQLIITEVGTLPEPVANNAVCEGFIDEVPYLYSFAGIDETKSPSGTHLKSFRYNIETGVSEQIEDLPGDQGLLATGASRIGNIIYIVGGYTVNSNGSEVSSRKVRRYDITNNAYLSDAADLIVPTDDHVQAVWRDSLLYVITGWSNNGNIRFTQVYDPTTDNWTNGTLLPNDNNYTSFGASGTIVGDKIYYFGGARSTGNFPIQNYLRVGTIDPDDPSNVEWSISQPDPSINGYRMAATSVDGIIHWVGGSNNTYNYDGIAYDGAGGVPTAKQDISLIVDNGDLQIDRNFFFMDIPMDLRGIANVADSIQYIAGGMLSSQTVSDKVFKLEWRKIVLPVMDNTASELGITIYPNPVTDRLNILNQGDEKIASYKLIGTKGNLILKGENTSSILVSDVTAGMYHLELTMTSGLKVVERINVIR